MQGPGQSLRQAREAHGRTIEEMSEATGIRLPFLTALEQDAFDSLPGRGFGKLYIRAYAEVLGFDPGPVIDAYDRAVRPTDAAAPASEPAAARPVNAVLARWRSELMARRAEADLSGEPEEESFEDPALPDEEPPGVPWTIERVQPGDSPPMEAAAGFVENAPARPLPVEAVSPTHPSRSRWWPAASLLLLVLLPLMAYAVFSRSTPDPQPAGARREPAPGKAMAPPPSLPQPREAVTPPRTPPAPQPPGRQPATSSSLEVAESGVGLRLVGTRLEGEGDRFRSGQRVTFATRVVGGGAGDSIHHVWLRDGRVEQSIRLRLGGASWRTWSTKTLGRPGAWAVEARDEQGHVLARAELTVTP